MPARPFCSRKGGRRKRRRGAATAATAAFPGRKGRTSGDSAPGCNVKGARALRALSGLSFAVAVARSVSLPVPITPTPLAINTRSLTPTMGIARPPADGQQRRRSNIQSHVNHFAPTGRMRRRRRRPPGCREGRWRRWYWPAGRPPSRSPIGMGWMNYATPPPREEQTEGRKDINNGISCRAQRPIGQMRKGGRARDEAWASGRGRGVRAHGLALIPCRGRRVPVHIRGASNG